MSTTQLGNPAAVMVAGEFAKSTEGKKAINGITNAAKVLLIVGGGVLAGKYAYSKYKAYRADKYARTNAGNPNLVAAAIIYNSFTRLGPSESSLLSLVLPTFNISTDEEALYEIASKVTNAQAVGEAYSILFDRNLFFDIQDGLDSEELQTFWNIINSPSLNEDTTTFYPIGSTLFVAKRNGITVNKAIQDPQGNWSGTNELFGQFQLNEELGKVVAHGQWLNEETNLPENYYIVEKCLLWGMGCDTGVVLQSQVRNKSL